MGQVGHAVSHAVTNIANTVKTVVTNPSKANIGQITSVVLPVPLTAPIDAAQHKEDRPILAAATATAIGTGAFLGSTAGASTLATLEGHSVAVAGSGAAGTLGLVKSIPAAASTVQAIDTIATGGGDGGGGPVPPPSSAGPPIFGPTGPSGSDFGVWDTSGGGGAGNIFSNPSASGTTTPVNNSMLYIFGGMMFFILLLFMQKKSHG